MAFDEAWVRQYCKDKGVKLPKGIKHEPGPGSPKMQPAGPMHVKTRRMKYGNEPMVVDGFTFGSKHEAERYSELVLLLQAGEILGFICQYPFILPGGVRYVSDFVILNCDGTFTVEDAKSPATRKDKTYRLKRRQMEACLGIKIIET